MSTSPPGKPPNKMLWDNVGHKEEEQTKIGIENCFFTDLDQVPFEQLLLLTREKRKKPEEEDKMDVDQHQQPPAAKAKKLKTIEFIVMVGFHHKVGS